MDEALLPQVPGASLGPDGFSFLVCVLFNFPAQPYLQGGWHFYQYVDDLLVTIPQGCIARAVTFVMHQLRRFSTISSVHINLGKSTFVLKGHIGRDMLERFKEAGLQQQQHVKCVRVKVGHLMIKEANFGPLEEAFWRVRIVSNLGLTAAQKS